MGLIKTSTSLLLLQAAAFLSGAAAGSCRPPCSPGDPLLVLFQSADGAEPFCSSFLSLPVSTVGATVTPTVVASVTETSYATQVTTVVDGTTTVTIPATVIAAPPKRAAKRDVPYPSWLPSTFRPSRVSSACSCLSVPLSVTTVTETATASTSTESATVTETTTSTAHSTTMATATAAPLISTRRVKIEVLRKDNLAFLGWLYNSNGPAVTSAATSATFTFTVPLGATTASQVRIAIDETLLFLGFSKPASVELENYYGSFANVQGTPPGSRPVTLGSSSYESDIFTINTDTRMIGWEWINSQGAVITNLGLYRVGGRLYPVGNTPAFMQAFSSVAQAQKVQTVLRYVVVSDS